jgi:MFS family permease
MYAPRNRALKMVGIIFYGFVAGLAATVAIVLGPIFLGLLAGWIFNHLGWEQASKSVAFSGLYYIYFTGPIGLTIGVIVCLHVWITRLRNPPTP